MAKRTVTVELDEETIRGLAALGDPAHVLADLAESAADVARDPGRPRRDRTDRSLRVERAKTDSLVADKQIAERDADEVVRIARERADQLLQKARETPEQQGRSRSAATEAHADQAREVLERERARADALLADERAERKSSPAGSLTVERAATDQHLTSERHERDSLLVDQRTANTEMVRATLRAQELAIEAEQAQERAEASARKLGEMAELREMFIAILGHDLRNPLGAITMSAGRLLRRGQLDEQDSRIVGRIITTSQRIGRMITQLLDLTRARLGGGLSLDVHPADLRELCENVAAEFEAPIALEVEGDLTGTWDADRLVEVLSNLAGNAIQHGAPGTPVIIAARAEGAEVVVEIRNQGPPIPADVLPFIFEPFRRADQRAKSPTGNLGLGLYIARQIVLAHEGHLDVRSEGGTTTFTMRLPRHIP